MQKVSSGEDSCDSVLRFEDVEVDHATSPSLVQFTLRLSKTDSFRKGVKVVIGRTGDELCPIAALLAYLTHRGGAPGPLFLAPIRAPADAEDLCVKGEGDS